MDDDVFRKLAGSAQFDQAAEGLKTIAAMTATLYTTYIEMGMPADLAADLIRDWAHLQAHKTLWPDAPPRGEE